MPNIEIRTAAKSEIMELALISQNYETSHVWQMNRIMEDNDVSINFRETRLPRSVKVEYPYPINQLEDEWDQSALILEARIKEKVAAYLRIKNVINKRIAWIIDLVVDVRHRRQGIGTSLELAAYEWATRNNYDQTLLEMQSKNYPAIQFSKKLGYEFCGYNDQYYANKDIVLFFARPVRK